jgi:arginyl-tRNA synthetase
MNEKIIKALSKKLKIDANEIDSILEIPPDKNLGDFAFPCFSLSKKLKKSPQIIAQELTSIKIKNITVNANGPYLNFFIDGKVIIEKTIKDILKKGKKYGKSNKKNQTILIDYSAPNVAKNMGIHNLRSTIIGQSLCNIYKYSGYKVIGINHLGDWGTQFGKLIWALEKWSSPKELKKKGILFLNEIYVKYHALYEETKNETMENEARAWSKKIEDGDERAKMWWKLFIDVSVKEYNKLYKRLNVKFSETKGESFYMQFLDETLKKLEEKKLTEMSEGALVVPLGEGIAPCLLKRSDGATLYGTRDIAAALYRLKNYNPTKILYVVDVAQTNHFNQVFNVLEKIDSQNKEKFVHVDFGRLSFADGAMSTRKGNIIPLKDVLDKASEKVLSIIDEKNPNLKDKKSVAEMIGIGAVIFGDLKNDRINNIIFDWDRVLDFQGETGPYIQYTIARINSIIKKGGSGEIIYSLLSTPEDKSLAQILSKFSEIIALALKENKPNHIAKYLVTVAQEFNNYYVKHTILQEDSELQSARLGMLKAVKTILENGLRLLNIKSPEEM